MTNDPLGLIQSGIPPELAMQYQGITKQQAIADALMKQGMTPGGEPINTGMFMVKRSPLEGVAKLVQAYMGNRLAEDSQAKMGELGNTYQKITGAALDQFNKDKQPVTTTRAPDPFEYDQMGEGTPEPTPSTRTGPPNTRQAIANLLMKNPWMASNPLVKYEMAMAQKPPTHVDLGGEQLLINSDGSQTRIPKVETPEGRANRDLKERLAQQKIDTMTPYQKRNLEIQARRLGISERALVLRDAELGLRLFEHEDRTGNKLTRDALTPSPIPGGSQSAPVVTPTQGVPILAPQSTTPSLNRIDNPQEKAAYDQVAANLARGVVGNAVPGGQFNRAPDDRQPTAPPSNAVPYQPQSNAAPAAPPADPARADLAARIQAAITGMAPAKARETAAKMQADFEKAITARNTRQPNATEQRMVKDADTDTVSLKLANGYLDKALKYNDKAMGFTGASTVATIGGLIPQATGLRPSIVDDTQYYQNVIFNEVLPQLKSIFGSNPSNREGQLLQDLSASLSYSPKVRAKILADAKEAIDARLKMNETRARQIRRGDYFKPQEGADTQQSTPATTRRVVDW